MTTKTRRIAALLSLGAVVLAVTAQYYFARKRDYMWDGIILYAFAALAFILVVHLVEDRPHPERTGLLAFWDDGWELVRREPARAVAVLLSVLAGLACTRAAKGREWTASYWDAFGLWILSCMLFLGAFTRREGLARGIRKVRLAIIAHKVEALFVVVITIVAGLLRLVNLPGIPYVLTGDEGEMGLEAIRVLNGELRNMFATGWLSHPTLFFFMQAAFLKIFGITVFGLRLFSALGAVATLPMFYLLLRLFWGRRISMIATTLLTFYHFHVHYSRIGLNNAFDPLFAASILYFFVRGLRSRRTVPFVISGALLGFSQYFYMGARVVPFILAAYLLFLMIRERGFWRIHGLHLVIFALATIVVAMPLFSFFIQHPDNFMARLNWLGIFQSGWVKEEVALTGRSQISLLWQQALRSVLAYNYFTDPTFWYHPGIPLLTFPAAILFVFGVAYSLYRMREPAYLLTILWLGLPLFFGAFLLENPPSSMRLVITAPPVMILVTIGIDRLLVFGQKVALWRRSSARLLAALLVAMLAFVNYNFYFNKYTHSHIFGGLNTEVADGMGKYLRSLGSSWQCYFHGAPRMYYGFAAIPFLAQGVEGTDVLEPLSGRPTFVNPEKRAVFIFLPERFNEFDVVRQYYPTGLLREFRRPKQGELLFVSYEVY